MTPTAAEALDALALLKLVTDGEVLVFDPSPHLVTLRAFIEGAGADSERLDFFEQSSAPPFKVGTRWFSRSTDGRPYSATDLRDAIDQARAARSTTPAREQGQ